MNKLSQQQHDTSSSNAEKKRKKPSQLKPSRRRSMNHAINPANPAASISHNSSLDIYNSTSNQNKAKQNHSVKQNKKAKSSSNHSREEQMSKTKANKAPSANSSPKDTENSMKINKTNAKHNSNNGKPSRPLSAYSEGLNLAFSEEIDDDNISTAAEFFSWLISPLTPEEFFSHYFEKKPLVIRRNCKKKGTTVQIVTTERDLSQYVPEMGGYDEKSSKIGHKGVMSELTCARTESQPNLAHYYSGWFDKSAVMELLASPSADIHYGRDIDVTSYSDGQRKTLNPSGKAAQKEVKSFIEQGCSIRFLCPQQFSSKVWRLCNLLDDFFGLQVGTNSYLTPAKTQGFAPHYDDVDILVMQTEGAKRWRLYANKAQNELLPQFSSRNFEQNELGELILDTWLEAGDFLYAPRGTIHQCTASDSADSMHITVSTCLKSSWADYLQLFLPRALQLATETHVELRKVMPLNWQNYMGISHSDEATELRAEFMGNAMKLIEMVVNQENLPIDEAGDALALDIMHSRVPPYLNNKEKLASNNDQGKKKAKQASIIRETTLLRLVKAGIARISSDSAAESETAEYTVHLHHILHNHRQYKASPLSVIDIDVALAPAVEAILANYPHYLQVKQLPRPQVEEEEGPEAEENAAESLIDLVEALFEAGLIEITNDQSKLTQLVMEDEELEDGEQGEEEAQEGEEQEEGGQDELSDDEEAPSD
jgi:lysine-specific demethylase/histidyl-hydroxylase NO66